MRKPKIGQVYEYKGPRPNFHYPFMKIVEGKEVTYGFGNNPDEIDGDCWTEPEGFTSHLLNINYSLLESYNVDELLNIYDKMVEEPSGRDEDTM